MAVLTTDWATYIKLYYPWLEQSIKNQTNRLNTKLKDIKMAEPNENPLSYQVGGSHYKKYEYQPIQLFADLDLGVIPANIIKYLARWRYKNGLEDLKKARHYALFWYELGIKAGENVEKFVAQFDEPEKSIMQNVLYGKTSEVVEALDHMIQICEDGQTHLDGESGQGSSN